MSKHTNQSGVHGDLGACFRKPKFSTLGGDVIREPPPYLRYPLGLGGKYVPFPHQRRFVKKQITKVNDRFAELQRVIVWDAFYKFCEMDCESKRPPFPLFPYKRFFVSRGTNPNGDIERKLGWKLLKIDDSIKVVANQTKSALDAFTRNTYLLRGASFCFELLESYLRDHVIIEGDKDGSLYILSRSCYPREAEANMHDKFLGSPIYRRVGNFSDQDTWLANEKRWANIIDGIISPMLPLLLNDFICGGQEQRSQWHGQQHCLAQKT